MPALLARGDLDLIVKQQSVTGFDVKLSPVDIAVSLTGSIRGVLHKRGICCIA